MVRKLFFVVMMALVVIGVASSCSSSTQFNRSAPTKISVGGWAFVVQAGSQTLPADGAHCLHGKLAQDFQIASWDQVAMGTITYAMVTVVHDGQCQEPRHRPPIV